MQHPRPPYRGRGPPPDPRAITAQQLARTRSDIQRNCHPNKIDIHGWAAQTIRQDGDEDSRQDPGQQYFGAAAVTAAEEGRSLDVGFEPYELYFDSVYRDATSNLSNGLIGFTIGGLNSGQPIRNVVMLRLTPFFFPRITIPATSPDFFFFNRIYLSIVSPFPTNQAFLASNGKRYHFELDVSNLGGQGVLLTPTQQRIVFRVPIQSLTGVQFLFTTPPNFTPINLPQDIITVVAVPGSNPARFQITDPGVTTAAIGPLGVQPAPGVAVFGMNFSSGTIIDPIVNNPYGFFVTNNLSPVLFETNLDFTTLATATQATIIVGKNRIAMQIEAVCATDHPTNYVKLAQI